MITNVQAMRKLIDDDHSLMQDQRSTYDQLVSLHQLANENGLYDAADWLKSYITKIEASFT